MTNYLYWTSYFLEIKERFRDKWSILFLNLIHDKALWHRLINVVEYFLFPTLPSVNTVIAPVKLT